MLTKKQGQVADGVAVSDDNGLSPRLETDTNSPFDSLPFDTPPIPRKALCHHCGEPIRGRGAVRFHRFGGLTSDKDGGFYVEYWPVCSDACATAADIQEVLYTRGETR